MSALRPPRPPTTAREALQFFMGDEHAEHTVLGACTDGDTVVIVCTCSGLVRVDEDLAHHMGPITLGELTHALRNPIARSALSV